MRARREAPKRTFLHLRLVEVEQAAHGAGRADVVSRHLTPQGARRRAARRCPELFGAQAGADDAWARAQDICGDYSLRTTVVCEGYEIGLDLTGVERLLGSAREIGREIRTRLRGELGLEAAMGVGPTATVAQLASRTARPGELLAVSAEGATAFIGQLPVEVIPGVDAAWGRWLRDMGIKTARDLAALSAEAVSRTFGERGVRVWEIARGGDPESQPQTADGRPTPQEEIVAQVGLRPATEERTRLKAALRVAAEEVAVRLKQQGKAARQVRIELIFDDLRQIEVRRTLPCAARSAQSVWIVAHSLLERTRFGHRLVRRVRLKVTRLVLDERGGQLPLPLPPREERRPRRRPKRPNTPVLQPG